MPGHSFLYSKIALVYYQHKSRYLRKNIHRSTAPQHIEHFIAPFPQKTFNFWSSTVILKSKFTTVQCSTILICKLLPASLRSMFFNLCHTIVTGKDPWSMSWPDTVNQQISTSAGAISTVLLLVWAVRLLSCWINGLLANELSRLMSCWTNGQALSCQHNM